MAKTYKIFMIEGIALVGIGIVLEILYWTVLKNIYWILLIYPPPIMQILIEAVPYIGGLLILIGGVCLITGFGFFLKVDLENMRKGMVN